MKKYYYLVFIGISVLYLLTLANTITATGDSSEMVVAPYILGVAHPPGYPLYTMVGHLFTYLPLSNIPYRISIFSMIFAMLALLLLFEILVKLTKNHLVSIITVGFIAVAKLIWEYSILAEVFALNNFFICLLFYLLLEWEEKGKAWYLYLFAFILGLSLTHHQTVLFLTPAFAWFIFQNRKRVIGMKWGLLPLLIFIGLLPYLYLPIRAMARPLLNWDDPTTIANFKTMVTRGDYVSPLAQFNDMAQFLKNYFDTQSGQFIVFLRSLLANFTFFGIAIGLVGVLFGKKYIQKYYSTFLMALLSTSFIFIGFITFGKDLVVLHTVQRLYILSFICFSIFVALGIICIAELLPWDKRIVPSVFLCFVVFLLVTNYAKVDKSNNHLLYHFTGNMLKSYPPGSIIVVSGDTLSMGIDYHQMVEKQKRDIIVVDQEKLTYPWYCVEKREQEKTLVVPFYTYSMSHPFIEFVEANYDNHKIYVTGPRDESANQDYLMIGQGLLRVLIKVPHGIDMMHVPPFYVKIDEKKAENDIIWKNFNLEDALGSVASKKYEPNSFEAEVVTIYAKARFNQGWAYDFNNKPDWAIAEYNEAIKIDPNFTSPYKNLGMLYSKLNRFEDAADIWEKYLEYSPNDPEKDKISDQIKAFRTQFGKK